MIGGLFLLTGVLSLHAAHVASEAPLCIFSDAEFLHSYKGSDPSHAMNLAKLQLIFTIVVFSFQCSIAHPRWRAGLSDDRDFTGRRERKRVVRSEAGVDVARRIDVPRNGAGAAVRRACPPPYRVAFFVDRDPVVFCRKQFSDFFD